MKLNCEDYEQLTVVSIKGELATDEAERFCRVAQERLAGETRDFVLDLSATEFIDSKGLESLLWLQEACAEKLGQVRFSGCPENVHQIFEITRLAGRFDCHDEIDAAIKSLR